MLEDYANTISLNIFKFTRFIPFIFRVVWYVLQLLIFVALIFYTEKLNEEFLSQIINTRTQVNVSTDGIYKKSMKLQNFRFNTIYDRSHLLQYAVLIKSGKVN